jgi:HEPN domain-containing protein
MLTRLQLRQAAWGKIKSAQVLLDARQWDDSCYAAGYAVEMMLKARICVDQRLQGWPQTDAEFKAVKPLKLKEHDIEKLLNMTVQAAKIKSKFMNDWSTCLQWDPQSRYQPMGTTQEVSARSMIRAAEPIIRAISAEPGLEAVVVSATDNPYVKLWAMERELTIERGPFRLFTVWHRKGAYDGSSDLIVSAPWINAATREGVEHVINAMNRALTPPELTKVSGVIALDKTHPVVRAMAVIQCVGAQGRGVKLRNIGGVSLDAEFLVTSQRLD